MIDGSHSMENNTMDVNSINYLVTNILRISSTGLKEINVWECIYIFWVNYSFKKLFFCNVKEYYKILKRCKIEDTGNNLNFQFKFPSKRFCLKY